MVLSAPCGCSPSPRAAGAAATLFWVLAAPVAAQESPAAPVVPTWRVVPSVAVVQTYTDNVDQVGDELARSSWITDVVPGIRIDANGARLKGFLDYRLFQTYYADRSFDDDTQHILTSNARLEAIEKLFFVDAYASILPQNRSPARSSVPLDRPSASTNRIETQSFILSPNVRGQIADFASYTARYNASYVRSDDDEFLPPTRVGELAARVRNAAIAAKIGWAIDVNALTARSDDIGKVEDARVRGSVFYSIDPLFNLAASYGREETDFVGPERQSNDTPGLGFTWQPSPRTQVGALAERRFFGTGHSALASYRTPRTVWRLASTRDASVLPGVLAAATSASISALLGDLLTSTIPDPAARAEAARRRLDEAGAPTGFPLATGTLVGRPLVYSYQDASVVFLGTRNTVTITATRRDERLAEDVPSNDGTRQAGVSGTWAYRLTPQTTLTATATGLRTEDLTSSQSTRQSFYSLFLSTQLGIHTTATIGVRFGDYDTPIPQGSYRENAVVGAVRVRL